MKSLVKVRQYSRTRFGSKEIVCTHYRSYPRR